MADVVVVEFVTASCDVPCSLCRYFIGEGEQYVVVKWPGGSRGGIFKNGSDELLHLACNVRVHQARLGRALRRQNSAGNGQVGMFYGALGFLGRGRVDVHVSQWLRNPVRKTRERQGGGSGPQRCAVSLCRRGGKMMMRPRIECLKAAFPCSLCDDLIQADTVCVVVKDDLGTEEAAHIACIDPEGRLTVTLKGPLCTCGHLLTRHESEPFPRRNDRGIVDVKCNGSSDCSCANFRDVRLKSRS